METLSSTKTEVPYLLCDPKRNMHRYVILIFVCMVVLGSYYGENNVPTASFALAINMTPSQQYVFSSLYTWQNTIIPIIGGLLIDRTLGIRSSMITFCAIITIGQLIVTIGGLVENYWIMLVGRVIFGLGGENLVTARLTYCVMWFKPTELNKVFGFTLSAALIGKVLDLYINGNYTKIQYTDSLLIGFGLCCFSLVCAIIFAIFDFRADQIINKQRKRGQRGWRTLFKDLKDHIGDLHWLIFITMAICTYYMALNPFLDVISVYLTSKYGQNFYHLNLYESFVYLIPIVTLPIIGYFADKIGFNLHWLSVGIIITLVAHVVVAFAPASFGALYSTFVTFGLGYAVFACIAWPLIGFKVPEYFLGTAFGVMQAAQNACLAIIGIAISKKIEYEYGYFILEGIFCVLLCVSFSTAIVLYLVNENSPTASNLNVSGCERARHYNQEKTLEEDDNSAAQISQEIASCHNASIRLTVSTEA